MLEFVHFFVQKSDHFVSMFELVFAATYIYTFWSNRLPWTSSLHLAWFGKLASAV